MIPLCLLIATGKDWNRINLDHFTFVGNDSKFEHDKERCEWFVDRFAVMSFMFRCCLNSDSLHEVED